MTFLALFEANPACGSHLLQQEIGSRLFEIDARGHLCIDEFEQLIAVHGLLAQ
jgi:hypothetical protein